MRLTVIGDVHGKSDRHLKICNNSELTLQLGDLGFNYDYLNRLDWSRHKFFMGNHDNYGLDILPQHCLGDFGPYDFEGRSVPFFFIRGGLSIDKRFRTAGFDYFFNEELNQVQMDACLSLYEQTKPDIVISHEFPVEAIPYLSSFSDEYIKENFYVNVPSRTSLFLSELLNIHRPALWIGGHFHKTYKVNIDGTEFRCLDELTTMDI